MPAPSWAFGGFGGVVGVVGVGGVGLVGGVGTVDGGVTGFGIDAGGPFP